jgi:hypothetical protein
VLVLTAIYVVVSLVTGIWGIVIAFQESAMWGLLSLFVPCAHFVFVIKFWDRAKTPFLIQVGSLFVFFAAVLAVVIAHERTSKHAAPVATPVASAEETFPVRPAPPKVSGDAVDLSTVMGRARALADAWQREAALCSIDATISRGLIQTGEGATATLVFGPSPFGAAGARAGSFIVTYDSTGMHGAASKQSASKRLIEPMCAPETAYQRATGSSGARVTLRYGLDSRGKNAVWLIGDSATQRAQAAFDNQSCAAVAP